MKTVDGKNTQSLAGLAKQPDALSNMPTADLRKPDPHLLRLLGKAFEFQRIFLRGGQSIADMATQAGVSSFCFARTLRLSFLSPDII